MLAKLGEPLRGSSDPHIHGWPMEASVSPFHAISTASHEMSPIKMIVQGGTKHSKAYSSPYAESPYAESDSTGIDSTGIGLNGISSTGTDSIPPNPVAFSDLVDEVKGIYAGVTMAEKKTFDIGPINAHHTSTDLPQTHSIPADLLTEEQLINEVRGIYRGLVMVEEKCIKVDKQQMGSKTHLSPSQWNALVALHRTLLNEHHNFYLASQHPSASPAMKRLAKTYKMPARMWRHGIHTFLELLRQSLPESRGHMLSFLLFANSMIVKFFEDLPEFEETWIECLGDISRYCKAIEEYNKQKHDRNPLNATQTIQTLDHLDDSSSVLSTISQNTSTKNPEAYERAVPEQKTQPTNGDDVRIYEIPCELGDNSTNALGDYGASRNFMREDYAIRHGFSINRTKSSNTTVGSGKQIKTVGTATATFKFTGEKEIHQLKFHLLPNCIHDVIIGKAFLKLTNTFSNTANFLRRVKQRIVNGISHFHLLYLGASTPMFEGTINGLEQTALADSGSKVLVMDERYARSIGLEIHRGHRHRTILTFADNSVATTVGMAYNVEWRFGRDDQLSSPHFLNFHILKNSPADVILNDSLLFETQAFSRYQSFLIDDDVDFEEYEDEDVQVYVFAIDKKKKQATVTTMSLADIEHLELVRRGEEADRISSLPEATRSAAQVIEQQRRTDWDHEFAIVQSRNYSQRIHPSSVVAVSQVQSTSSGSSSSGSTANVQQTSHSPRPPRKSFSKASSWLRRRKSISNVI